MFDLFKKHPPVVTHDINEWPRLQGEQHAILVDVRTEAEFYQQGHVPGSVNYPFEELSRQYQTWFPDVHQPICLYCLSGSRSRYAAKWLAKRGYTQMMDLGDVYQWRGTLLHR